MVVRFLFVFHVCMQAMNSLVFDSYTAKIASKELLDHYKTEDKFGVCTIEIEPCCATERRRLDGSCNNIDNPAKGTYFSSFERVLPALYFNGSYSRKTKSDKCLPSPEIIQKIIIPQNICENDFTPLMYYFGIFMLNDVATTHENSYYCIQNETVCSIKGMNPNDNYLNKTYKLTHQYFGCTNDSIPSQVVQATSVLDLSQVYNLEQDKEVGKSYVGGQIASNRVVNDPSPILPVDMFVVWLTKFHNYFATQLAVVNPCWDDDTLFYVAREINIAFAMQIYLHDWLAQLEGYDNLIKAGIISDNPGFRDLYNETMYPAVTLEFTHVFNWFQTVQQSAENIHDDDEIFLQSLNHTRHFSNKNKYMAYLRNNNIMRKLVGKNNLPHDQPLADTATARNLRNGRFLGIRPYIDYVYYCTGHKIKRFYDLVKHVEKHKISKLMKVYADVTDIDLLAGIMLEKYINGGNIPQTLACLLNDNILKSIKGDRYWYERPDAFTKKQLLEIRKASLALLLCKIGAVTEIQKKAFVKIGPRNPVVKCCDFPSIDFRAWTDPICLNESN